MTVDPRYSADDYTAALAALRPRGRVWPVEADSQQVMALAACSPSYARLDAAAQSLLIDMFPATTMGLLPEWQESLGLPDPCVGPDGTLAQAQVQVVSRLTATGGQSAQTFIDYAASLGFLITIDTFAPFRCGSSSCGDGMGSSDWSFAWGVRVNASLNGFANSVLLCELNAIKPVETTLYLES